MLDTFPIFQLRLSRLVDGDLVHDVLAVAAGIRERERGVLFDEVRALLASRGLSADLSLTVADSIEAMPCSVAAMARRLADKVEPVLREAMRDERRAA